MGQATTVKSKLIFLLVSVMMGLSLFVGITFYQMNSVFNTTNYANTTAIPKISEINQIGTQFGLLRIRLYRHLITFEADKMQEVEKTIEQAKSGIDKNLNAYQKLVNNEQEQKLFEEEKQLYTQYLAGMEQILILSRQNKTEEASKLIATQQQPIALKLQQKIQEHVEFNEKRAHNKALEALDTKSNAILILVALGIGTIISIAIQGLILIKNLYTQLGGEPIYAVDITKEIAHGNLSQHINASAKDEGSILVALKKMQDVLKNTVRNITQSTSTLTQSINQLNQTTEEIKRSSEHQAEASGAVASTIEELTVSIESIHHNSAETLNLSKQSKELSLKSKSVVDNVVNEVRSVANIVETSVELTKNLGQRSQEINSIVGIISEVAEQTNLLALNAAIEAARAGESGKGFAVVADEVRKLAERTSQSTDQIRQVINAIRNDIDKVVDNMNQSEENVNESVHLAQEASKAIDEIVDSSSQMMSLISDISSALEEQSSASQNIAHNVEKIAHMSEENNRAVLNTAQVVHSLQEQSNALTRLIQYFKI